MTAIRVPYATCKRNSIGIELRRVCVLTFLVLVCLLTNIDVTAADLREFPFCNGECANSPDRKLVTNIGTPFVHLGDTGCKVVKTNDLAEVHSGKGAFEISVNTADQHYAFFMLAVHGFYGNENPSPYWQSRDLSRVSSIEFWFDNRTGTEFTLKLELKDYRDSNEHTLFQRVNVPAAIGWRKYQVTISQMEQNGNPDLHRIRFLAYVIEELAGQQVDGTLYFDDMTFRELGGSIDVSTASDAVLSNVLARRMIVALWGSRDREHGLVPRNSAFANHSAINSTGGLIALLPVAVERKWLARSNTDAYVDQVCDTLKTLMLDRRYVPSRYVDSRTLEAVGVPADNGVGGDFEESPVDAAILALALVKYRVWLSNRNPTLVDKINSTLNQFDFKAFFDPAGGFRFGFMIDVEKFKVGFYDSYSTEVYLLALTAQVAGSRRVSIKNSWNAGVHRVRLGPGANWFLVAESSEFRSPFMQYLLDLFVRTSERSADNFPDPSLRQNPWKNAQKYQRFVTGKLAARDRGLQPDAGEDYRMEYKSYSFWRGPTGLHMPWSAAFVHVADKPAGLAAFRTSLISGHHSLFGFSESVRGETPLARADLWNVSLCALALTARGKGGNRVLARDANIASQLDKVFPQPKSIERAEQLMFNPVETALEMTADSWQPLTELIEDSLDAIARQQLGE